MFHTTYSTCNEGQGAEYSQSRIIFKGKYWRSLLVGTFRFTVVCVRYDTFNCAGRSRSQDMKSWSHEWRFYLERKRTTFSLALFFFWFWNDHLDEFLSLRQESDLYSVSLLFFLYSLRQLLWFTSLILCHMKCKSLQTLKHTHNDSQQHRCSHSARSCSSSVIWSGRTNHLREGK